MKKTIIILTFLILLSCSNEADKPQANIQKTDETIEKSVLEGANIQSENAPSEDTFQLVPDEESDRNKDTESNIWRKYDMKSGVIEYEMNGMEGFENLFWDNYGALEARYHVSKRMTIGDEVKENEMLIIYNDSIFYSINFKDRTGIRRNMNKHLDLKSNLRNFNDKLLKEIGATHIGKGEVLKRECDKWKMQDGVVMWIHKGLPLKIEFGQVIVRAKAFRENPFISKNKFIVPADIKITEE